LRSEHVCVVFIDRLETVQNSAWRFWPIMTNVDRKMASSETMSVSLGHGVRFGEQHPAGEADRVDVDERHRAGERGDGVGDAELDVGCPTGGVLDDDRMMDGRMTDGRMTDGRGRHLRHLSDRCALPARFPRRRGARSKLPGWRRRSHPGMPPWCCSTPIAGYA